MAKARLRPWRPLISTLLALFSVTQAWPRDGAAVPAIPLDPVDGIVAAFKSHAVVALGEGDHNNEQGHAVRLKLIRDPRFAKVANDIVVEFGNSRYQDVMDRYVRGEPVPPAALRQAWQDTTQAHEIWDVPIYAEFFRAVRDVNAKLPKRRQLRVLLGDAPIDWQQVHTRDELRKVVRSDKVPAGIIEREVLGKGRRALVIYGDMHYSRRNTYWTMEDKAAAEERFARPVETIVALLEKSGTAVFSIHTSFTDMTALQPDVATWTAPQLALIQGTPLGLASSVFFYPDDIYIRRPDNSWEQVKADPRRSPLMQDQFDAILYLGPPDSATYSTLTASQCADPQYMQMRLGRMRIAAGPNGASAGAELQESCAKKIAAK
jgi:hypothetical protein